MKLFVRRKRDQPLSKKFGLSGEKTFAVIDELLDKGEALLNEYNELGTKNTSKIESLEMTGIRQQIERNEVKIANLRDWHGLFVLEALHAESRRLKWLTVVLIALTAILAIFTGYLIGIRL